MCKKRFELIINDFLSSFAVLAHAIDILNSIDQKIQMSMQTTGRQNKNFEQYSRLVLREYFSTQY